MLPDRLVFFLTRGATNLGDAAKAVPPTGLVLLSISSTQLGAAIAKSLFNELGSAGTVLLRVGFAAIVLLLLWRPRLKGYVRANYFVVILFGLVLAGMNLCFYYALERIPLGIAVTIEFVGPLAVAIAGSRRLLDLLWVLLAASGIVLLAPLGGRLDPLGVVLALLAGSLWGAYILLSARVGRAFSGGTGLAIAMAVATLVLLPVGVLSGGAALLNPQLLTMGFGVALLSSALPYSLELEALRRLKTGVFGVLMSLEPAIAAAAGFVILNEKLEVRVITAILLVSVAAAGASRFRARGSID